GGMSSNEQLAKIWHFLALYSYLTSSPRVQYPDVGQDQPKGRGRSYSLSPLGRVRGQIWQNQKVYSSKHTGERSQQFNNKLLKTI
ncbi:hypothetical protein JW964_29290, partial [candidate division KSB1 bacterium]|nr:hypothetical protein [candidate division KSB1 bacterium]